MMKIDLSQLKKAIHWLEANTNEVNIQVYTGDMTKLMLKATDRLGNEVEITLFNDSQMMPKIRKTEILK